MDPATGASTWALGSHRWIPYIGILAIKAIIRVSQRSLGKRVVWLRWGVNRNDEFIFVFISRIPKRRGNDAVMVYIIM